MKKIIAVLIFYCGFMLSMNPITVYATEELDNQAENTNQPYADDIGWRYQMIDGKLYKRQYNYTKEQWIGKWVLA